MIIAMIYYYNIFTHTQNLPHAFDDVNFFINQFEKLYLKAQSIPEKIQFLIHRGNWPHPKILGRILSIFHYGSTSSINFRFCNWIGHLYLILFLFLIAYRTKFRFTRVLAPAFLLFIPAIYTFNWAVASNGYFANIAFSFGALVLAKQQKWFASYAMAFLAVFSAGPGIFILIPLTIIIATECHYLKTSKILVFSILTNVFISFIFFQFTLEQRLLPAARPSYAMKNEISIINKIIHSVEHAVFFVTSHLNHNMLTKNYPDFSRILSVVIIITLILGCLYLIKVNFEKYRKCSDLFYFLLYLFSVGIVAGFMRAREDVSFVAGRYEIYSVAFFVILVVVVFECISFKNKRKNILALIVILLGINYCVNIPYKLDQMSFIKTQEPYKIMNYIISDQNKKKWEAFHKQNIYKFPLDIIAPFNKFEKLGKIECNIRDGTLPSLNYRNTLVSLKIPNHTRRATKIVPAILHEDIFYRVGTRLKDFRIMNGTLNVNLSESPFLYSELKIGFLIYHEDGKPVFYTI